jgi:hypothetical protein
VDHAGHTTSGRTSSRVRARAITRWSLAWAVGAAALSGSILAPAMEQAAGAATTTGTSAWGPLAAVAYGNAQLRVPENWPVVAPGATSCGTGPGRPGGMGTGVVLLGAFGTSAWCPPADGTSAPQVANIVRLGPLPAGEPAFTSLPKIVRNGITLYEGVLHGRIPGRVYLVPSLGVELMASGPNTVAVLAGIGASVRSAVLAHGPGVAPTSWHRLHFSGLSFAVPPTWAVTRSAYVYDCQLQDDDIALGSPPQVTLDTDTNDLALPCPYFLPPLVAADGLVVAEGSAKAPNTRPPGALAIRVNGLSAFVDPSSPLSVLVVDVKVPGRSIPVQVHIGLGDAATAAEVLGSIELG